MEKFLLVDGTSALLTIALWGGLGYVGGNNVQTLTKNIRNLELIFILILAGSILIVLLMKYLKHKRKRIGGPLLCAPHK